jgi:hypothetical protein
MCLLYLWRYWPEIAPTTWRLLGVQLAAYALASGAIWGACVGTPLALMTPRVGTPASPARPRRGLDAALRAICGGGSGALGCVPAGVIAATHFGQMPTPYFGGLELILAAVGTIVCAAIGFGRGANPARSLWRCALAAILPFPLLALLVVPISGPPLWAALLEVDVLRVLAGEMGLGPLGAALGAGLGALAGAWVGLSTAITGASPGPG